MTERADIVVIGAGAAGLMAATWAGRSARERGESPDIVVVDGARTLGAKILVAGGGRCNVTHHTVDAAQYAGSTQPAIKNVLRRFDVARTVAFFQELDVELKREDTGKLFPVTDDARTVLNALLRAAREAGAKIVHPWRVAAVTREKDGGFLVHRADIAGREESIRASAVVLATGGKSLPKSGSDGMGHVMARSLGHTITERVFPSLVPLVVDGARHALKELSGIALEATVEVRAGTGKVLKRFTNSILITHFGYSGPGILDVSRYYLDARASDPDAVLAINWIPAKSMDAVDGDLQHLGKRVPWKYLVEHGVPERLARMLCAIAGVDASTPGHALSREERRTLVKHVCAMEVPVSGDRGWNYAEVTAGGVPLAEVDIKTMESRVCPGLFLVGEICDVDGRIGGFNFQWAWATGFVAGTGAATGARGGG